MLLSICKKQRAALILLLQGAHQIDSGVALFLCLVFWQDELTRESRRVIGGILVY